VRHHLRMSEISHCNKCVATMSHADHRDESIEQDGLCIACRKSRDESIEEEAVASFCNALRNPVEEWFSNIITGCGFEFSRRLPADTREYATALFYTSGSLQIQCHGAMPRIVLSRPCPGFPTQPDWFAEFHCPMPERIILSTIKTAMIPSGIAMPEIIPSK